MLNYEVIQLTATPSALCGVIFSEYLRPTYVSILAAVQYTSIRRSL